MKTAEFDYSLPESLIAQFPTETREKSHLLCINKTKETFSHEKFSGILNYFKPGDVLVLNNTKVIPSRLFAYKENSDTRIEVFLLNEIPSEKIENLNPYKKDFPYHSRWEVLLKPGKRIKKGDKVQFKNGTGVDETFFAENPESDNKEGIKRLMDFYSQEFITPKIEKWGNMPLPPYIKREAIFEDRERYQTVFAEKTGAVAAPTAGLHFSTSLLEALKNRGVTILNITLHVGYDTFRPVQTEDIASHKMHTEKYEITDEVAKTINQAKRDNKRIIACGTTVVRALEASAEEKGEVVSGFNETNIFIYPHFSFQIIDGLITNFHLPKSSLLMLVSAFGGKELIMNAYQEAIEKKYRFYSFGDAMFIY